MLRDPRGRKKGEKKKGWETEKAIYFFRRDFRRISGLRSLYRVQPTLLVLPLCLQYVWTLTYRGLPLNFRAMRFTLGSGRVMLACCLQQQLPF